MATISASGVSTDDYKAVVYASRGPRNTVEFSITATGTEAGDDEVQVLTIDNAATGVVVLSVLGEETDPLTWPPTATEVEDALLGLSRFGADALTVTGGDGGPYTVTFGDEFADTDAPEIVIDVSGLANAAPTIDHATLTPGSLGVAEVQTITINGAVDGLWTVTDGVDTSFELDWDAPPSDVQDVLEVFLAIGVGNVVVTGAAGGPYTVTYDVSLGNVAQLSSDASGLVSADPAGTTDTSNPGGGGVEVLIEAAGGRDLSGEFKDFSEPTTIDTRGVTSKEATVITITDADVPHYRAKIRSLEAGVPTRWAALVDLRD